jgi:hypothetical protein
MVKTFRAPLTFKISDEEDGTFYLSTELSGSAEAGFPIGSMSIELRGRARTSKDEAWKVLRFLDANLGDWHYTDSEH